MSEATEGLGVGRGVVASRWVLGVVGVLVGVYGTWLLLSRESTTSGLVSALEWLVGGAIIHDAVIAPVTLALVWLGRRLLPRAVQVPAAIGLLVLGSATLFAIPVLGRFGARADNATLLDRNYTAGWLVFAALVLVGVVAGSVWRARRDGPTPARGGTRGATGTGGTDPGGGTGDSTGDNGAEERTPTR